MPALRAALHLGDVIAGEVGEHRRAIVFHGDAMNTASRLEQATRDLNARFIASSEALEALQVLSDVVSGIEIRARGGRGRGSS